MGSWTICPWRSAVEFAAGRTTFKAYPPYEGSLFRVSTSTQSSAPSAWYPQKSPVVSCIPGDGLEVGGVVELKESGQWDVSRNCVTPVFRSPVYFAQGKDASRTDKTRILFLSEGNVCRSVYAEAIFTDLVRKHGLQELVECSSKAIKDYNLGESPDYRAVVVAHEVGLQLRDGQISRLFECYKDMVEFDLVLVMDKFNASDVLKEVTIYEAIDKTGRYSNKVRFLGEFCKSRKIKDIDDPLYGNMGGAEELELLRKVYSDICDSCEGLIQLFLSIYANKQDSESLKQGIVGKVWEMEALDWLRPPMLQRNLS